MLSNKPFTSLQDYVHHAQTRIQKLGLTGEKWFVACFLNGIPNGDYHWTVYDKDPTTFEEAVNIVLQYHRTSKKDHNKPEFTKLWMSSSLGNISNIVTLLTVTQINRTSSVCIARSGATQKIPVVALRGSQQTPLLKTNLWVIQVSFFMFLNFIPTTYLDVMIYSKHSGISMEHKHISCLILVVLTIFLMITWCSKCNST